MVHSSLNPDVEAIAATVEAKSGVEKPQTKPSDRIPDLVTLVGRNYVTLNKFADLVGVTYQTALRFTKPSIDNKTGQEVPPKVKVVKIGGTYRIYETELRRFLDQGNAT